MAIARQLLVIGNAVEVSANVLCLDVTKRRVSPTDYEIRGTTFYTLGLVCNCNLVVQLLQQILQCAPMRMLCRVAERQCLPNSAEITINWGRAQSGPRSPLSYINY